MLETTLYILAVLLLVLANGFFVAAEFSLVSVRRSRIEVLAENGDRRAPVLLGLLDNLNGYISATQLGITMASLALGWVGEPAFARLLEKPLAALAIGDALRHTVSFAIAFTAITFLHIVLGELAPKTLALERAERVALLLAWPMLAFHKVFRWPVRLLDHAGTVTVRMFGLRASSGHGTEYTPEELRHLIDVSQANGSIEPDEQKLLQGVFEFADTEVREVMVPRSGIVALPVSTSLDRAKAAFRDSGFSRLPVYRDQLDSIIGILYRRDLEPFLENPHGFDPEKLIHQPEFIPPTTQLSAALRQMQARRTHLAVVVDEYGGIEGIVTLEDLLEEIVGEIVDEFDDVAQAKVVRDNDSYLLDGMLTIREINEELGIRLPEDGSYTTIAGFVLDQAGKMVLPGESIEHHEGCFTVEALDMRRISRLRFTPATPLEN